MIHGHVQVLGWGASIMHVPVVVCGAGSGVHFLASLSYSGPGGRDLPLPLAMGELMGEGITKVLKFAVKSPQSYLCLPFCTLFGLVLGTYHLSQQRMNEYFVLFNSITAPLPTHPGAPQTSGQGLGSEWELTMNVCCIYFCAL